MVVELPFIKGEKHFPEEVRAILVSERNHTVQIIDNCVTECKRQHGSVKTTRQMECYLVVEGCSGHSKRSAPTLHVCFT